MESALFFDLLKSSCERPPPFSRYTAADLWTDEHTSAQMLAYHLNESIDVSSRRQSFIEKSVAWMAERFELADGLSIADFGCGPGLYTSRLAALNNKVLGIDFSSRSIGYAREFAAANGLDVEYVHADYLEYQPRGKFDLITMIMCDFCALSPAQRARLLSTFRTSLAQGGQILLDVYSMSAFADKREESYCEKNQLDGFWSADDYYALVSSFKYPEDRVSLDKYTIVEANRTREVYNWLQYFTPESLEQEVRAAGLSLIEVFGDVAGNPIEESLPEFAVVLGESGAAR